MSKKIIGIDLGGTSIKFAILTLDGEVQEKWSIKTNILDEGSHIVDDMIESIAHRLKMLELDASEFQGIGIRYSYRCLQLELEDPSTSQRKDRKRPSYSILH